MLKHLNFSRFRANYVKMFNPIDPDPNFCKTAAMVTLVPSPNPHILRETTRPGLAMIVLDFVFWTSVLASVNQEQGRVSFKSNVRYGSNFIFLE